MILTDSSLNKITFLPYKTEVTSGSSEGLTKPWNERLVMFSRGIDGKKLIIAINNISFEIGVNLTKASRSLGITIDEAHEKLREDLSNLKMRSATILTTHRFMKPFHEYSNTSHEYAIIDFKNSFELSKYVSRFNGSETILNTDNTYLCDDEYRSSLHVKLSRERDISLCDWCVAEYVEKKELPQVTLFEVSSLRAVRQLNPSTIFNQSQSQSQSNDLIAPQKKLLISSWDLETYSISSVSASAGASAGASVSNNNNNNTKKLITSEQVTKDVSANKDNNIAYTSVPFIISVAFQWSSETVPFLTFGISVYDFIKPQSSTFTALKVQNEKKLLLTFFKIIRTYSPDIITGFNDNSFDWIVLLSRASHHDLLNELYNTFSLESCYGRALPKVLSIESLKRESEIKIKGDEFIKCNLYSFHGLIAVDTMCLFRKLYPDDDRYSLNHFLSKLGLQLKEDVSYEELEIYRKQSESNNSEEDKINMGRAVSYCVNDSVSLLRLWNSRGVFNENQELAKISFTDLEHSFFKAGGSKVRNTVIGFIKNHTDLAVSNTRRDSNSKGKYQGALVLPIQDTLNRSSPLACLDFNSLYPSVIMAYNYSPEKVVQESQLNDFTDEELGPYARSISITKQGQVFNGKVLWHNNQEELTGVYPRILNLLFKKRVEIKNKLQNSTDKFTADLLDTQQRALKIIMNTFYGEAGNPISAFYNVLVAGSVTARGIECLQFAKKTAEEHGWRVWYGDTDSIFVSYLTLLQGPDQVQSQVQNQVQNQTNEDQVRGEWSSAVNDTISRAQQLATVINDKLRELTQTSYLRIAYEKVLFPVAFFCKKRYCGYIHEKQAQLEKGKEKLYVTGLQVKTRGNAPILAKIGNDLINSILHPILNQSIEALITAIIDKHLQPTDDTIDLFSITKTFRSHKNNIQIHNFVNSLPSRYKINDLAKFDYVLVKRQAYDPILGKIIKDSKSRHMMLKCQYLDLKKEHTQTGPELDLYQYLTGAIGGMILQFLKLSMNEEAANHSLSLIVNRYKTSHTAESKEVKRQFSSRCKLILSESSLLPLTKVTAEEYVRMKVRQFIREQKVNTIGLLPTDFAYRDWFTTFSQVKEQLIVIKKFFDSHHESTTLQPSKKMKFTDFIINNWQSTNDELISALRQHHTYITNQLVLLKHFVRHYILLSLLIINSLFIEINTQQQQLSLQLDELDIESIITNVFK